MASVVDAHNCASLFTLLGVGQACEHNAAGYQELTELLFVPS